MLKKNVALGLVVMLLAGCGTELRTYVITKSRVGLDRGNGNGGCVMGTCPAAPAPAETTRKVYVLEVTRPVPESEVKKIEETAITAITDNESAPAPAASEAAPAAADNTQPQPTAQVSVPVVGELPGTVGSQSSTAQPEQTQVTTAGSETTYTVQKDDTLQKISKKVYGTYKHWYKIYKANKDKIKNPNVLQAGTVLTIPVVK